MNQGGAIIDKFNELKTYIEQGSDALRRIPSIPPSSVDGVMRLLQQMTGQIDGLIDKESGEVKDEKRLEWELNSLKEFASKIIEALTQYKKKLEEGNIPVHPSVDETISNFEQAIQSVDSMLDELRKPQAPASQPQRSAKDIATIVASTKKAALLLKEVTDTIYDIISDYKLPPNVDFQKLPDRERNELIVRLYDLFWKNYNPQRGKILQNLQTLGEYLKKEFRLEEAPQFLKEVYDRIHKVIEAVEPYLEKYNLIASATELSSAFDILDDITPEKIEVVGEALKTLEGVANDILKRLVELAVGRGGMGWEIVRRIANIRETPSVPFVVGALQGASGALLLPTAKERAAEWINAKLKQRAIEEREEKKGEERFRVLVDERVRRQILQQTKPWVMKRTFLLRIVRDALENLYNFLAAIPPLLEDEQAEYAITAIDPAKFPQEIQEALKEWIRTGGQLRSSLGNCIKVFRRSPRQPIEADVRAIEQYKISEHLQAFIKATKELDEAYKRLPPKEQEKMRNPAPLFLHPSGLERLQQLINSLLAGSRVTKTFVRLPLLLPLRDAREHQQLPIELKHIL